jgi:hypothetical protein
MPLQFYNTSSPTPNTKNTINSVTVEYGIRDFLLGKKLLPRYPFISTNINGSPRIGEPVLDTSINSNSNSIPFGLPLEKYGLLRYDDAILNNKYKNDDGIAPTLLNIENVNKIKGIFGDIDFPQGNQSYPTSSNDEVSKYGLIGKTNYAKFRTKSTLYNLYVDNTKQIDMGDFITLNPSTYNTQLKGYLDEYGSLNLGDSGSIQAANVIGSFLNGQGVGFSKSGIVSNFNLRSSLAGRVLGATGTIKDTKLGIIGGQQLTMALANNSAFNLEKDLLGKLNIENNLVSLAKGNGLVGSLGSYQITVPSSNIGKIANFTERILGFTVPRSYLDDSASIFSSEYNSGNIERANSMLNNTGKGQIMALIKNMNANLIGSGKFDNPSSTELRSGYSPGYIRNAKDLTNSNIYAYYTTDGKSVVNILSSTKELIPDILTNKYITQYGFKSPDETFTGPKGNNGYDERKISDIGFTWFGKDGTVNSINGSTGSNPFLPLTDKKSLLVKTQKLFNSKNMLNIVSVTGDMGKNSSQIETANGGGFSKGSAVLTKNVYGNNHIVSNTYQEAGNTYCRSWTTEYRYETIENLIRHSGLTSYSPYPYRHQTDNSVLDDNGMVKISPYKNDTTKKYMFSIENLAWADKINDLIPCEVGIGDLLTGKKGRIMWFPPYDIKFSESTSVNWEKNDFIGRGESVYTYNNTERSGQLSFKIIIDHSSYINSFRGSNGPDDNYVASFMAGCVEPEKYFVDLLKQPEIQDINKNNVIKNDKVHLTNSIEPIKFKVYFPNDVVKYDKIENGYENGLQNSYITGGTIGTIPIDRSTNLLGTGYGLGDIQGEITPPKDGNGNILTNVNLKIYNDSTNFGLNANPITLNGKVYSGFTDTNFLNDLNNFLNTDGKHFVVNIKSTASIQGYEPYNSKLVQGRYDETKAYLQSTLKISDDRYVKFNKDKSSETITNSGCNQFGSSDSESCKKDRYASISIEFDPALASKDIPTTPVVNNTNENKNVTSKILNRFYSECSYFEKLTQGDKFVFDSFREKIRFFHPAFHSTTPEGFNSRLTFLNQCTRQGGTNELIGANNLAFGRPPVCILRIGDFYNTKIVIDSLSIDYEPLVWDLNPEGVGVQPMIANVSLSFKFIGGSTLMGAINKLQNALSFNYYANTQVYDARADYISKDKPIIKVKNTDNTVTTKEVKDSTTGYYINNTINDSYFGDLNNYTETNTSNNDQTTDQIKTSEKVYNAAGQEIYGGTQTDIDRITLTDISYLNNTISFHIRKKDKTDATPLSKGYYLLVTVSSLKNTNEIYSYSKELSLVDNMGTNVGYTINISDFSNASTFSDLNSYTSLSNVSIDTSFILNVKLRDTDNVLKGNIINKNGNLS